MDIVKDWLGQEVFKGALVLYATSYGSSTVETRFGRVRDLGKDGYGTPEAMVEWLKSNKRRLPLAKATKVRVDRLTVMPESMSTLL